MKFLRQFISYSVYSITVPSVIFPDISYMKQHVSISTKRMGIYLQLAGHLKQGTDMQVGFNFYYQLGIPYQVYQKLIHLKKSLTNPQMSKSTEPIVYGYGTEKAGESGVPEVSVDFLDYDGA